MSRVKRTTTNLTSKNEFNLKGISYSYDGDLTTIDNCLNVLGKLMVSEDSSFNSFVDISDGLNVVGPTTLTNLVASSDASFNSNVNINGTLNVNGPMGLGSFVDMTDGLNVVGPTTLTNLVASSDASFNSNVDIIGDLIVTGDTSLNSFVDISDGLNVVGPTTLTNLVASNDVSINNNLHVNGSTRLVGPVTIDGSLDVNETSFTYTKTIINSTNLDVCDNIIKLNVKDISTNQTTDLPSGIMVQDSSSNVFFGYSGRKEGQEHSDKFVITKTHYDEESQSDISLSYDKPIDTFMNGSLEVNGNVNISGSLQSNSMVGFAYQVVGETNDLSAGEYPFAYGAGAYDQDEYFGYPISINSKIVEVGIMLSDSAMVSGDASINEIVLDINGTDVSFNWDELRNFSMKTTKKYPKKSVNIQLYDGDMMNIQCKSLILNNFPNRYDVVAVEKARIILKFLTTEFLSTTDIASQKIVNNTSFKTLFESKGINIDNVESNLNVASTDNGEGLLFDGVINIKEAELNTLSEIDQLDIIESIQQLYSELLEVDVDTIIVTLEAGSIIAKVEVYDSPDKAALVRAPPIVNNPNYYWEKLGQTIIGNDFESTGFSIALNGDGKIMAIGNPTDTDSSDNLLGSVDVYEYNDISWVQVGERIIGSEGSKSMAGESVSLSTDGSTVAFGESTDNSGGKIRILRYNGSLWEPLGGDISGEMNAGKVVSLNNNGNIISFTEPQSVKIYEYKENTWTQLGNTITNNYQSNLSIKINGLGNIIIVGHPVISISGVVEGQAEVFKLNSSNLWEKIGDTLSGNVNTLYDGFNVQLNYLGTIAAISSNSDVNVYKYNKNGIWEKMGSSIAINGNNKTGLNISLSNYGHIVSVGEQYSTNSNGSRLRVYEYITNEWVQIGDTLDGVIDMKPINLYSAHSLALSSDGTTVTFGQPKSGDPQPTSPKQFDTLVLRRPTLQHELGGQLKIRQFQLWIDNSNIFQENNTDMFTTYLTSDWYDKDSFVTNPIFSAKLLRWHNPPLNVGGMEKTTTAIIIEGIPLTNIEDVQAIVIDNGSGGNIFGTACELYNSIDDPKFTTPLASTPIIQESVSFSEETPYYKQYNSEQIYATVFPAIVNYTGNFYNHNNNRYDYALPARVMSPDATGAVSQVKDGIITEFPTLHRGQVDVYKYVSLPRLHYSPKKSWQQLGDTIYDGGNLDHSGWGQYLSSDGTRLAIGSPRISSVKVYDYIDSAWSQIGEFNGDIPHDSFGQVISLSSDGSRLAITAMELGHLSNYSLPEHLPLGYVKIYDYVDSSWVQVGQTIIGPMIIDLSRIADGNYRNQFGKGMSMSRDGKRIGISAPEYDVSNNRSGKITIYEYNDVSWVNIGEFYGSKELSKLESITLNYDGSKIAMGDTIADNSVELGGINSGVVKTYEYIDNEWVQYGTIYPITINYYTGVPITQQVYSNIERNGWSLEFNNDGNRITISSKDYRIPGIGTSIGAIRTLEYIDNEWVQIGQVIYGNGQNNWLGEEVSISKDYGNIMAGGAYGNDVCGNDAGRVVIYEYDKKESWVQLGEIYGIGTKDQTGHTIKLNEDGTIISVSSPGLSKQGLDPSDMRGFVKVYKYMAPKVTDLSASAISSTSASISFVEVEGATNYTVTSSPHSIKATGKSSPIIISGLTSGTSYTFTVTASDSIPSVASNAIIPKTFIQFLSQSEPNTISIDEQGRYIFNNVPYNENEFIGLTNGLYRITGIDPLNPIGFLDMSPLHDVWSFWEEIIEDNTKGKVEYSSTAFSKKSNSAGNEVSTVRFFSGDILLRVRDDFGTISYKNGYRGEEGGENRLKWFHTSLPSSSIEFNTIVVRRMEPNGVDEDRTITLNELQLWMGNTNMLPRTTFISSDISDQSLGDTPEFFDNSTNKTLSAYDSENVASNLSNTQFKYHDPGYDVRIDSSNNVSLYIPLTETFNVNNISHIALINVNTDYDPDIAYRMEGLRIELYNRYHDPYLNYPLVYTGIIKKYNSNSITLNNLLLLYRWDLYASNEYTIDYNNFGVYSPGNDRRGIISGDITYDSNAWDIVRTLSPNTIVSSNIQLLTQVFTIEVDDSLNYIFNNIPYDSNKVIGLNTGTYYIANIPQEHAIAFLDAENKNISNELLQVTTIWHATPPSDSQYKDGIQYHYGSNIKIEVKGDFGTISYKCINHGYMGGQNRLKWIPPPAPEPEPTVQLLSQTNTVEGVDGFYVFNDISYSNYDLIGLTTGTYQLNNIPIAHPIGFVINDTTLFEVTQGTIAFTDSVEGITINYYTGDITIAVKGDFGTISYNCYYHGYMGGQNRLKWIPAPEPEPTIQMLFHSFTFNSTTYGDNTVEGVDGFYIFNDISYGDKDFIGVTNKTYRIINIPSAHPIGFVINDTTLFEVTQGTIAFTDSVEGITINYYTGDITIEVKGNFGTISYNCYYHGYMGGQNRLKWVNT